MADNPRQEEQDLTNKIALGLQEPCMTALRKLLELRVRKLQDQMLNAPVDELVALQIEARVINKLAVQLTKPLR